ncbi:MAG: alpha/beta fold hydrolase [Rhodocyclaceae bacterium]|nr:alpha/beta fold hydrolase [Rhodocyclaceae bacterium]
MKPALPERGGSTRATAAATDRPPVLLLHGWGGSFRHTWQRLGWVERLAAAGYPVIGPDLPGHGVAQAAHDPLAYADIAHEVDRLVGHHRGVIGIGYSLGAKLLLTLATRHPDLFRQLVLIGIGDNAFKPLGASEALARALREGLPSDTPPALARLIADVRASGNDPEAMAACITRPQESPLTEAQLAPLTVPTLIANGTEDRFVLPQERLLAALPSAETVMFDGFDHMDVVGRPEVMDAVLARLNRELARSDQT